MFYVSFMSGLIENWICLLHEVCSECTRNLWKTLLYTERLRVKYSFNLEDSLGRISTPQWSGTTLWELLVYEHVYPSVIYSRRSPSPFSLPPASSIQTCGSLRTSFLPSDFPPLPTVERILHKTLRDYVMSQLKPSSSSSLPSQHSYAQGSCWRSVYNPNSQP